MGTQQKTKQETYYESIIKKGYSRRDFIKFTTYIIFWI